MSIIDLRLLVLSADGTEPNLTAIRQILDYLGTPYSVYVAAHMPGGLTADMLSAGDHAFFQGIVLTTGNLGYARGNEWISALSTEEWQTLRAFETTFGIRQITWYTYPTSEDGFQIPATRIDATTTPVMAGLTNSGQSVFTYMNAENAIAIKGVYVYLARPLADERISPLLQDSAGNALMLVQAQADGRENLALTFDSNASTQHSWVLAYGLINWVARGLFLGERHSYLNVQIDDMFMSDAVRTANLPCDSSASAVGATYRMSSSDMQAIASWQKNKQAQPIARELRLCFAFNGCGVGQVDADHSVEDTLTPEALRLRAQFHWVSHTYDHAGMDNMDGTTARAEIQQNLAMARDLGLAPFSPHSLVTPGMSGLNNPDVLLAAHDSGVRYLVSDASYPGHDHLLPNTGKPSPHQPSVLAVPRHPTNLYYDVTTPEEWVSEYNCRYVAHWGRNLTYDEILDRESDTLLGYLLQGDIYPLMFHQSNLRAYDGTHSLLSDLLDRTLAKFTALVQVPISSLAMDELAERVAARMRYNGGGITASLVSGRQIILSAQQTASVPITGLYGSDAEFYCGQWISHISLEPGMSVTLPFQ